MDVVHLGTSRRRYAGEDRGPESGAYPITRYHDTSFPVPTDQPTDRDPIIEPGAREHRAQGVEQMKLDPVDRRGRETCEIELMNEFCKRVERRHEPGPVSCFHDKGTAQGGANHVIEPVLVLAGFLIA